MPKGHRNQTAASGQLQKLLDSHYARRKAIATEAKALDREIRGLQIALGKHGTGTGGRSGRRPSRLSVVKGRES